LLIIAATIKNHNVNKLKLHGYLSPVFLKLIERKYGMNEKKQNNFKSPDLSQLQEIVIDLRTKIYIAHDADPEEARNRYLLRYANKKIQ
jgi:hypothetical protein